MKSGVREIFATVVLLAVSSAPASAQSIAGTDPITGAGGPDGWTNILYINESEPFEVGNTGSVLTYTNFWASRPAGLYTPFVAEPTGDGELGEDFTVRAIGTTRVGGVDFTCNGEYRFPFHDTETFQIQDGWVAGFVTSDPDGLEPTSSPIPFEASDVEGWLTGSAAPEAGAPAIELNDTIIEGDSGTDIDAFGFRRYQFNVSSTAGATRPNLEAGGKVGEACPTPGGGGGDGVGAPLPFEDGQVDGWSGMPVMYGNELPAGESVEVVRYYAAEAREFGVEDELYQVTPVIVKQEDGSIEDGEGIFSVWEIGPNHTPTEAGDNEFEWGSSEIPDDGKPVPSGRAAMATRCR